MTFIRNVFKFEKNPDEGHATETLLINIWYLCIDSVQDLFFVF